MPLVGFRNHCDLMMIKISAHSKKWLFTLLESFQLTEVCSPTFLFYCYCAFAMLVGYKTAGTFVCLHMFEKLLYFFLF